MCGTTLYVRPSDCHHFCDPSAVQQRAALCCVGLRVRPLRRHPSAPHPQGTGRLPMQPAPVVSLGAPFPRHRRLRVVSRALVTLSRPSGQTRRRSRVVFRDCEIPRRLDGEAREAAVRLPCPLLPFVPRHQDTRGLRTTAPSASALAPSHTLLARNGDLGMRPAVAESLRSWMWGHGHGRPHGASKEL